MDQALTVSGRDVVENERPAALLVVPDDVRTALDRRQVGAEVQAEAHRRVQRQVRAREQHAAATDVDGVSVDLLAVTTDRKHDRLYGVDAHELPALHDLALGGNREAHQVAAFECGLPAEADQALRRDVFERQRLARVRLQLLASFEHQHEHELVAALEHAHGDLLAGGSGELALLAAGDQANNVVREPGGVAHGRRRAASEVGSEADSALSSTRPSWT